MTATVQIPDHVLATIERPNGDIEVINYTVATKGQIREFNAPTLRRVNDALKAAGRGRVVSFENVTRAVAAPVMSASDRLVAESARVYRTSATGRA